jgi:O-antigen ligase
VSTDLARRAVATVPLVLVVALGADQGGFLPGTWVWAGALLAWAGALAVVLGGGGAIARGWPWAAAALALLLWTLASTLWSANSTQSLLEARRTLVYAAAVLALIVLARGDAARVLVVATHLAVSLLLAYALARYLLGSRRLDEFEGAYLSRPLGYANAVGILSALGLLLGLGIAATTRSSLARAAAAATVPVLVLALGLTGSRASWLAAVVGGAVLFVLHAAPARVLRTLAVAAPGSVLLVWLAHRNHLTDAAATPARLPVALAAVGVALATAVAVARLRESSNGRPQRRLALVLLVVVALAGAVAIGREGSSQPRASYWHVAWHEYTAHPLLGSGAGTFALFWERSGRAASRGGALDAHSLYLETLAELGPLGLALVALLLLLPLRSLGRRRHVPYAAVAASAYAAFLVHAGLDWDWELPAVVLAGLSCAGALVLDGEDSPARATQRARVAVAVALLVLGACAIAGARSQTVPSAASLVRPQPGCCFSQGDVRASVSNLVAALREEGPGDRGPLRGRGSDYLYEWP